MTVAADPDVALRRDDGGARPTASMHAAFRGPSSFTATHLVWLLALTLLAAFLRLYKLGEWSFWVDEAHTFRDATSDFAQFQQSHVVRYPLSFLLLRAMLWFLPSTSEGWLRLPFAFFGIATVPALAFVARGIVGRPAALLAATLLALSPWHIYWSQNCRSYAMVCFLAVLAMGAFYEASRRHSLLLGATTVLLTVLAGACHPSAYLLLGAYLAFWTLSRLLSTGSAKADAVRTPLEKWLPWLILGAIVAMAPIIVSGIGYFARAKPGFSFLHLLQTTVYFVRAPMIVAAIGGFLWLLHRGEHAAFFLACWIVAPLVVLSIPMFAVTAQYAFYTLPAFCLLAGAALRGFVSHITEQTRLARLMRAVPLGILAADALGYNVLYFQAQHGDRPNWRAARDWIDRRGDAQGFVLTTNGPSMCYYLDPEHMLPNESTVVKQIVAFKPDDPDEPWMAEDPAGYLDTYVERCRSEGKTLYVVLTEPELHQMDPTGRFEHHLRATFRQVLRLPVWTGPKDMEVFVYELPPAATGGR
ncbi:MAG: hypothetical protein R3F56_03450 [Planctomycetota bacterium]